MARWKASSGETASVDSSPFDFLFRVFPPPFGSWPHSLSFFPLHTVLLYPSWTNNAIGICHDFLFFIPPIMPPIASHALPGDAKALRRSRSEHGRLLFLSVLVAAYSRHIFVTPFRCTYPSRLPSVRGQAPPC